MACAWITELEEMSWDRACLKQDHLKQTQGHIQLDFNIPMNGDSTSSLGKQLQQFFTVNVLHSHNDFFPCVQMDFQVF